jgi:hypothetical protein
VGRVDLEQGITFIEERNYRGDTDVPKTERSRRALPLGHLLDVYRQFKPVDASPDDYVFHIDGRPMDGLAIARRHIKPAANKLGFDFPGFGWHTFRRQNLTLIQEEGATAIEAQAQAGHARPVMTAEYTFFDMERREQGGSPPAAATWCESTGMIPARTRSDPAWERSLAVREFCGMAEHGDER